MFGRLDGLVVVVGVAANAVLEDEQTLSNGIRVAHLGVVHKRDRADAPGHESARHVAAERAAAEQQALLILDRVQVDERRDAPLHQLEVQVDGRLGQLLRVHRVGHVDHTRMQLSGYTTHTQEIKNTLKAEIVVCTDN